MSEPRVAGLVCEGHTDVPVLRAVIEELWPEIEDVRCLQPELDESHSGYNGCGALVRRRNAPRTLLRLVAQNATTAPRIAKAAACGA